MISPIDFALIVNFESFFDYDNDLLRQFLFCCCFFVFKFKLQHSIKVVHIMCT